MLSAPYISYDICDHIFQMSNILAQKLGGAIWLCSVYNMCIKYIISYHIYPIDGHDTNLSVGATWDDLDLAVLRSGARETVLWRDKRLYLRNILLINTFFKNAVLEHFFYQYKI